MSQSFWIASRLAPTLCAEPVVSLVTWPASFLKSILYLFWYACCSWSATDAAKWLTLLFLRTVAIMWVSMSLVVILIELPMIPFLVMDVQISWTTASQLPSSPMSERQLSVSFVMPLTIDEKILKSPFTQVPLATGLKLRSYTWNISCDVGDRSMKASEFASREPSPSVSSWSFLWHLTRSWVQLGHWTYSSKYVHSAGLVCE